MGSHQNAAAAASDEVNAVDQTDSSGQQRPKPPRGIKMIDTDVDIDEIDDFELNSTAAATVVRSRFDHPPSFNTALRQQQQQMHRNQYENGLELASRSPPVSEA